MLEIYGLLIFACGFVTATVLIGHAQRDNYLDEFYDPYPEPRHWEPDGTHKMFTAMRELHKGEL